VSDVVSSDTGDACCGYMYPFWLLFGVKALRGGGYILCVPPLCCNYKLPPHSDTPIPHLRFVTGDWEVAAARAAARPQDDSDSEGAGNAGAVTVQCTVRRGGWRGWVGWS